MTAPGPASGNFADGNANVGVQAEWVNGDVTVYQVPEGATAEDKYRIGVNYLDGGMPGRAYELISEAVMSGYETSEAWFHCLLALLSGRTVRQFSEEDRVRLRSARANVPLGTSDDWTVASDLVFRLVDAAGALHPDPLVTSDEIEQLGERQRDLILRHLELFLSGALKDQMWKLEMDRLHIERMGNDREARVWKFFQPKPAKPRVRPPVPGMTPAWAWVSMFTSGLAAVAGACYIGSVLLSRAGVLDLLAYLISVGAGGCVCAVNGLNWRFRVERIAVIERRWNPDARTTKPPAGGFASKVDKAFDYYFIKYAPDSIDRKVWLARTAGIRGYLRDEIVEIYREQRIPAERIAWLIRYEVGEVKRDWRAGGSAVHTRRLIVRPSTKANFAGGLVTFLIGFIWTVCLALPADPLDVSSATLVVAILSLWAMGIWLHLVLERKRYTAEQKESDQRLTGRWTAYRRWTDRLADKPSDGEMAAWLDWERKALMDHAMRRAKLAPREIIADAFIEAPARGYKKRARVLHGPWRYTKYHLLAFLLTADGVRQVTVDLDFQKGSFHDWKWMSYRFDAVVSVEIHEQDDRRKIFELVLMNGQPISAPVTEPEAKTLYGEDPEMLSATDMDAAGLTNAFQILEGIAAEGKEWIQRKTSEFRHSPGPRANSKASETPRNGTDRDPQEAAANPSTDQGSTTASGSVVSAASSGIVA